MISGANTYRILSDERGSVRLVVNVADGAIAEQLDYDEFGRVLSDTAPGFQPFGFAGGLYDPDTGLVRFGLRDYSPQTGQWTARDPLTFAGGETSLYAYVLNDPVNLNDLTGTGPFGLKTRWGATTALDGALFQGGNPKGGNDGQLQAALDGANNQVKGALTTGAGLTAGGAVAYVAGATALLASTVAPLAATSTAGSGFASVAPAASTAAAQVAGVDAATTGAATAAPALEAAPAAVAPTASSASAAGADAAATQAAAAAPAAAAATPTAAAAAAPGAAAATPAAAAAPAAAAPSAAPFIPLDPLLSQWL
jgi:RHS repeat-associated protein